MHDYIENIIGNIINEKSIIDSHQNSPNSCPKKFFVKVSNAIGFYSTKSTGLL